MESPQKWRFRHERILLQDASGKRRRASGAPASGAAPGTSPAAADAAVWATSWARSSAAARSNPFEGPRPSGPPRVGPMAENVRLRDPEPGDLGWIVQRHGALYAAEYGWNSDFEGLVARIVADFAQDHDPYLERVWIAELDGRPVGSVMCVREDGAPGTARLRLLLVDQEGRGRGIGTLLVDTVVAFARSVGYRELVLWTNDVLTDARELYLKAGFTLIAERPHRSYGVSLTGQDWRLPLQEGSPR
ncbi:GNAT family N-acetyltransferase [Streptomyces sp. MB09-01]|uniref:GNAT family N-acetyltransferase n=1 Tax=Streptomyces sp. MB09-01 TaxID=3028666 RepID=UPI003A5BA31F